MKKHAVIWLLIALICLIPHASAEEAGIDVLVRGQTAIMRIDNEWLQTYANQDVGYSPFSYMTASETVISESQAQYHLEGAEAYSNQKNVYEAFMEDYPENGYAAQATIYNVGLKYDRFTLPMYIRHAQDCWYLIFRQMQQPDPTAQMHCGIDFQNVCNYSAGRIIARSGVIVEYADFRCIPDSVMSIQPYADAPEHRIQRGDIHMDIFRGLGVHIVVITKPVLEVDFMKRADIMVADNSYCCGTGYMDGNQAVYCIVMDDLELQSLLDASNVELVMCPDTALMEY